MQTTSKKPLKAEMPIKIDRRQMTASAPATRTTSSTSRLTAPPPPPKPTSVNSGKPAQSIPKTAEVISSIDKRAEKISRFASAYSNTPIHVGPPAKSARPATAAVKRILSPEPVKPNEGLEWLKKQISDKMLRAPFSVTIDGCPSQFSSKAEMLAAVEDLHRKQRTVRILFLKQIWPESQHSRSRLRYAGSKTITK